MVPISVFRSRRRLRPKTYSEAEDFSIFRSRRLLSLRSRRLLSLRSRRPLSLRSRRPLSLQEPEDLFGNRRLLNLQGLKISPTHCTFLTKSTLQAKTPQDKRYIMYLAEDLCPSLAQQVSHAFNA
ncbi:hypothetical protein L6452_37960 [Arctium lappa]|uniref:Uncharacterized protein n=1 Tax=Arctium lappa TaxID=4217 RepID=A0ACB8Y8J6_ARCLA|nr:hypothetical protein L6452_37960 [Arctium lappa]